MHLPFKRPLAASSVHRQFIVLATVALTLACDPDDDGGGGKGGSTTPAASASEAGQQATGGSPQGGNLSLGGDAVGGSATSQQDTPLVFDTPIAWAISPMDGGANEMRLAGDFVLSQSEGAPRPDAITVTWKNLWKFQGEDTEELIASCAHPGAQVTLSWEQTPNGNAFARASGITFGTLSCEGDEGDGQSAWTQAIHDELANLAIVGRGDLNSTLTKSDIDHGVLLSNWLSFAEGTLELQVRYVLLVHAPSWQKLDAELGDYFEGGASVLGTLSEQPQEE